MNDTNPEKMSQKSNLDIPFSDSIKISSIAEPVFDSNRTNEKENISNSQKSLSDKEQLQATPSTSKSTLKSRKNKNDLYFCCTEDSLEPVTSSSRQNKDRERNTKTPLLKRGKAPEEGEEPVFERRPALLLRFFPDGTAVLISKFQLHLHVKPKQIKFEPDDVSKEDDVDFNPDFVLNDGKSYEVTYKRLESIPSSREQNIFDLDESEERESYSDDVEHRDHEFITTVEPSISTKSIPSNNRLFPLQESSTLPSKPETEFKSQNGSMKEKSNLNESAKASASVGDSPFFIMTSEEMASLQHQYDPSLASPLKATTSIDQNSSHAELHTAATPEPLTTTITHGTLVTTESSNSHSATFTTTTKCLSFKNQLSLALSTEDNIDNSLLKRHIFPTEDCNNPGAGTSNPLAKLENSDSTTKPKQITLPIITRTPKEPVVTPSYSQNNLVPYLASQFSNDPSKPDVVVVTSLPVLIDLKSKRNEPVTNEPAWREVTVGVVRDQQGQPLKPRYNNWVAHLRGLRKKTENKFWNDFTTPKPDFRSNSRQPIQNIQQSPSQINRAFWTDLQRQDQVANNRNKDRLTAHLYRTDPPRNYPAQNKNEYQFWRIRNPNVDERWNPNGNSKVPEYRRTNGNFENMEVSF